MKLRIDENKDLFINLVNDFKTKKYSVTFLSNKYNFNRNSVSRELKKLKLKVENIHNKPKFNYNIFSKIDTEEKAYWLGFLYADGYVGNKNNQVELSLQLRDQDHLKKYKKFLKAKNEVVTDSYRCRMIVTNKKYKEDLVRLGCYNNKSLTLTFPNLNIFTTTDLIKHFIRGYVDGDGCLCIIKNSRLQFALLGTKEFLNELQKHLPILKTHKLSKNNYKSESNTFVLSYHGKTALKVTKYLYENNKISLTRKFKKYKLFKKFCRI